MGGEVPFTHYAEVNPKRHLRRGEEYPFVEMAALPEGGGELRYLGRRIFDGQGSRFAVGDTLFARITPCTENGKASIVRKLDGFDVGFGSTEFIVLAARDGACPEFVYQVAVSPEVRRRAVSRMLGTSGRQRVPTSFFEEELRLPAFAASEQHGIGAVLRAIDEAIEQTEAVIAATEAVRKALLLELLTRGVPGWHTEWKTVPGVGTIPACWEVVRLGDCVRDSVYGPRFPADRYDPSGNVATLRTTDLNDEGEINLDSMPLARLDLRPFESFLLAPEDLVITRSGSCGVAAVFEGHDVPVLPGAFLIRLRCREGSNPRYLKLWLNSAPGREATGRIQAGGVQKNINAENLKRVELAMPKPAEQSRILELASEIRHRELRDIHVLRFLRDLKAELADALLSGRVRVPMGGWPK
jgi:type I restriction enzyme S subunit